MDTVVIYPGRFHPFHKGHKSVYDTLVKRFGKNRVFIATSDKVDPPKSPFTFEEKRAMIALTGVDPSRVIKTKSPYQATEITDNYDPQNTIALFAVSDKDMAEDPRFSFKPKKDGSASYYQPAQKDMESLDKHGYIITVPTLSFNVLGKPMRSASEFRANFAKADTETQKKMITDLFGKYNPNVDRIMSAKIIERLIRADEILDKLIEMGADDKYIVEACARVDMLVHNLFEDEDPKYSQNTFSIFKKKKPKKFKLINPIKGLSNLKAPNRASAFDKRKAYSLMPEQKKNCGCGQDPCITYGIAVEDAVTVTMSNGKTIDISHLSGKTATEKAQTFNKMFANKFKNVGKNIPNYTINQGKNKISGLSGTNLINTKKELGGIANKFKKELNTEEITNFNNQDPMNSIINIKGIGTMSISSALDTISEMSMQMAKLAKEKDAKFIQNNFDRYMSLLTTYNNSVQEAYKELAQQRKRGGTKSRGIDKDITEAKDISYENWDHPEAADYSKFLEKAFGDPDEFTNEQTVWHNKDGFKRIVCRDEYILHGSPAPHYDFVYCYIDLEVDEDLSDELAKCSGSILIDHLKNEVGARCGSLTANAVTLNFCLDVTQGRAEPVKEEYEKRILDMKDMFANGKKWEVDWWPDEAGDADPDNPYYAESVKTENMLGKVIDKFKTDFKKRDTLFAKGGVKTKPKVTPKQKPIPKVKQ